MTHPPVMPSPPPRATLAAIQLPTDLTLESEGPRVLERVPGVRLRLQKVHLDGEQITPENYATGADRITQAARGIQPADSVDAIGLACTSMAFSLGQERVQDRLREAHPSARSTDMATSLLAALEHFGARRVTLLTPYSGRLTELVHQLLETRGVTVKAARHLELLTDAEMTQVAPSSLREALLALDSEESDAAVLGCSALRTLDPGFLDQLEAELGKPVISSQQAFLWHLLRMVGVEDRPYGFGSLLRTPPGEAPRPSSAGVPTPKEDAYPSRVASPALVERVDPVVSRSTTISGPLTEAQVDLFERRGALVMRGILRPAEVAALRDATLTLKNHYEDLSYDELDRTTDMRVITERGGSLVGDAASSPTLKSIWQIHLPPEHAPHLREAAPLARRTVCDARLIDAARQLLGEEVYVHQSRINYQTGVGEEGTGGSGFLWHQDFEQWHCEDGMPRMRAVSMAVLLERATPANGALMVMPGSHRQMLQAFGSRDESDRYAQGALSRGPRLPLELLRLQAERFGIEYCSGEPGDVVLFDCNTIHGSHTNISPWGRCMFFAVYNAVSNTPAATPFAAPEPRPEHIGSHDPRFAGIPLPSHHQDLAQVARDLAAQPA